MIAGRKLLLLSLTLWTVGWAGEAQALDRIYVCRHMEKGDWPGGSELAILQPLSREGAQHAVRMAQHLASANLAAVYTSETVRAWSTGLTVARQAQAGLIADDITILEPQMAAFLDRLREVHANDEAVLIVGHSNTVPELLVAWGAQETCFEALGIHAHEDEDMLLVDGYDNLFVIDTSKPGCEGISMEAVK